MKRFIAETEYSELKKQLNAILRDPENADIKHLEVVYESWPMESREVLSKSCLFCSILLYFFQLDELDTIKKANEVYFKYNLASRLIRSAFRWLRGEFDFGEMFGRMVLRLHVSKIRSLIVEEVDREILNSDRLPDALKRFVAMSLETGIYDQLIEEPLVSYMLEKKDPRYLNFNKLRQMRIRLRTIRKIELEWGLANTYRINELENNIEIVESCKELIERMKVQADMRNLWNENHKKLCDCVQEPKSFIGGMSFGEIVFVWGLRPRLFGNFHNSLRSVEFHESENIPSLCSTKIPNFSFFKTPKQTGDSTHTIWKTF